MAKDEAKLGDRVRDQITGFTGIVVAETKWLTGCARLSVQPETLHEGKVRDQETFDVNRLIVMERDAVPHLKTDNGGPGPEPRQPSTPRQR
jgi:hypothetical protein